VRGARNSNAIPCPSRTPIPALKSGTFYFAKKRNFLNCVDRSMNFPLPLIGLNSDRCCNIALHSLTLDFAKKRRKLVQSPDFANQ